VEGLPCALRQARWELCLIGSCCLRRISAIPRPPIDLPKRRAAERSPTYRESSRSASWVSSGIDWPQSLPVIVFADAPEAAKFVTSRYSFRLLIDYGAPPDWQGALSKAASRLDVIAGESDELMDAAAYNSVCMSCYCRTSIIWESSTNPRRSPRYLRQCAANLHRGEGADGRVTGPRLRRNRKAGSDPPERRAALPTVIGGGFERAVAAP
jgi:hypothetical protein